MKNYKNIILVPKLNNSGGVTEIIYLKNNLETKNCNFEIIPLFGSKTFILRGFLDHIRHWKNIIKESKKYKSLVVTHYTTLFFSFFFNREIKKSVFIQCLEWKVISRNIFLQFLSKVLHFICFMRITNFIFANKLLKKDFESDILMKQIFLLKKTKILVYPVGHRFINDMNQNLKRNIDILIILRNNWVKRYDLYLKTLSYLLDKDKNLVRKFNLRIINLSSQAVPKWINNFKTVQVSKEISHQELFLLYKRSKTLLYLSFYEGFGLPPLEAMSQGCVPIISNNRGQYNYLSPDSDLILKRDCQPEEIADKLKIIFNENEKKRILRKNSLIKNAENYYNIAEKQRKKEINNIVKAL